MEEGFDVGQRGVQGCLAQLLTGLLALLFGQVALERNGLLKVKRLEIPVLGVAPPRANMT